MHPVLFTIPLPGGGHFEIAMHGVMLALGAVFATFLALRLAKKDGLAPETVVDLAFWAVLSGVVGAKLWYVAQFWGDYEDKLDLVRNFRSGLVYYGGVLGALITVSVYVRVKKVHVLKALDVMAPAAALGLAFGRTGCLLNGCCYGRETASAFSITFPNPSIAFYDQLDRGLVKADAPSALPVLPTEPVAIALALVICVTLLFIRRYRKFYGEQIALFFILYAFARYAEETMRGDNAPVAFGLTAAQATSVLGLVGGLCLFAWLRVKKPKAQAVRKA